MFVSCVGIFIVIEKPFAKHYLSLIRKSKHLSGYKNPIKSFEFGCSEPPTGNNGDSTPLMNGFAVYISTETPSVRNFEKPIKEILKPIWKEALTLTLVYAVTYSVYPSIIIITDISFIKSSQWFQITIFLIFNLGDFLGRLTP